MLSPKVSKFFSPISGNGIKAVKDIKKGEVLIIFEGEVISSQEANKRYDQGFDYMLQIDSQQFLVLEEDSKYVNHSCSPTAAFIHNNAELVALDDLSAGTEITFDYSANEDTDFKLNCQCNSPKCRKEILPYSKTSPRIKYELKNILSPYLRNQKQT